MPTKIGTFEILSELAKSDNTVVYKANDPQSGQAVALKAIQLSAFGEEAPELEKCLLAEADSTKILSSSHITPLFGAGEIGGKFCAAMEYVQGNSIATMLARKEGFSIWDLLDIGRQVCSGLDHAHGHKLFHYSLEPSKIMCGWDGTVKILSFGVSSVGKFVIQNADGVHSALYYMSPEQVRGEQLTSTSNIFSIGAMFYEMVTDQKPFPGDSSHIISQAIQENEPVLPTQVNSKIHPVLSALIMKALSKDPAQRYQSGRELLDDLEKCKDSRSQTPAKSAAPAKGLAVPEKTKAAAAPAVSAPGSGPAKTPARPPARPAAVATASASMGSSSMGKPMPGAATAKPAYAAPSKAVAAAASAGATQGLSQPSRAPRIPANSSPLASPDGGLSMQTSTFEESMSSAAVEEPRVPETDTNTPQVSFDPMMAEGGPVQESRTSFSEIDELPPLKEVYIAPPAPVQEEAPLEPTAPTVFSGRQQPEKPKVQPREVAQKAIKEIQGVPPKLMIYSIASAVILILVIAAGIAFYNHHQNSDDEAAAAQPASAVSTQVPARQSAKPAQPQPQERPAAATTESEAPAAESASPSTRSAPTRGKNSRKKSSVPAAAVISGQLVVDSTPQGAQVQVDRNSDPAWITPYTMVGLSPGPHRISASKPGYVTDTRTVDVLSNSKVSVAIHLGTLLATLSVVSSPAGANVYVDGKDTGKLTPAQFSFEKGSHLVLVKKPGYLDETATPQLVEGQTSTVTSTMRALGNADDIKTVGKFKKMFGGNGAQANMGTVSVRTQPKGAQVAVNQHMLDKTSPVDFALDPGNYIIDVTMSGYAPIHKVVSVDKGSKVVLDQAMQPQQ